MSPNAKTAVAIKARLSKSSGIIAKGLSKPKRRLIKEMIYSIQGAKDVKLSNTTRALNPLGAHQNRRPAVQKP